MQKDEMKKFVVFVKLLLLAGGTCAFVPCPRQLRQYLVWSGGSNTVYDWGREEIALLCRPANNATCQWTLGSRRLGPGCTHYTSSTGEFKCSNGEEEYGTIKVRRPGSQRIRRPNGENDYYESYRGYGYYKYGQKGSRNPAIYLCWLSGKIVDASRRCDGQVDCRDEEDEQGCTLGASCTAPGVGEHSRLVDPRRDEYAHNTSIAYACDSGYTFHDMIGSKNRTCRHGQWHPARPFVCYKNLAAQRPVSGDGIAIPGLERNHVVDGAPSTWSILLPGQGEQSMEVSLPPHSAPSHVLVMTTNVQFDVQLEYNNTEYSRSTCTCRTNDDGSPSGDKSTISICDCSTAQSPLGGANNTAPVNLIIRSDETLVVAEVMAINTTLNSIDHCRSLDQPTHGKLNYTERWGEVSVVCNPGYLPRCGTWLSCQSESLDFGCVPVNCGRPPSIARADIVASQNGSSWGATVRYACQSGYAVFPTEQSTTAVCGDDGLWSIGHLSCVADTDIRVVTSALTQRFQQSVDALRLELENLRRDFQRTQQQLDTTQQQLQRLLTDD